MGISTLDEMTKSGHESVDKLIFTNVDHVSKTNTITSKKCQPAAGDRLDLIQTMPVPSSGLSRPKKINRTKNKKIEKRNYLSNVTLAQIDELTSSIKIKTQKCQPAAGDRLDLIQTTPVPSSGLARPKKINRTKKIKI